MIQLRYLRWVLIGILGIGTIGWLWWGDSLGRPIQVAGLWIATVIFLIAMVNWWLHHRLDDQLSWETSPGRRFSWQLGLGMLFSLLIINLTYWLFKRTLLQVPPDAEQFLVLNLYGAFFLLPVISVHGVLFLIAQWRKSIVYSETLKRQQVRSELESLKNHLDPHFLFNNLNILSSLIDQNPEQAQDFLGHFSEVYRYVLRQREEELVPLRSELEFLDAYVYMLRQRFRTQVHIQIDIYPNHRALFLPPLALQMLIENAIKHNKSTEDAPLHISIQSQDDGLQVCNNLQAKRVPPRGTGFGLTNLRKRYEYLSEKTLSIEVSAEQFCVFLPLLLPEVP